MPSAASVALNFVDEPSSFALSLSESNSAPVAPVIALTFCIPSSNDANTFTIPAKTAVPTVPTFRKLRPIFFAEPAAALIDDATFFPIRPASLATFAITVEAVLVAPIFI